MSASERRKLSDDPVEIGDEYINIHALDRGIRIADERTIKSIDLAKKMSYRTSYIKKVIPTYRTI